MEQKVFLDVCEDLEKKKLLLDDREKTIVAREVLASVDERLTLLEELITKKVKELVSLL